MTPPRNRPIDRLLIANRGEIAVRIARTASRLGIETVGVYSGTDTTALHVRAVDRAVALGGASPATSYLRADAVLAAAIEHGCDAVHPGYGFLAENAAFARSVVDAGLVWVGPTPEQIELLGDKIAAKAVAVRAGVPTTAVITVDDDPGPDRTAPAGVTYPALVKAAAGGGGRGMRIVTTPDELPDAIDAARREALAAFGDDTVFIEPYVQHGRHVEVQIVGDVDGAVVHLGDRDCSVQRRNQKVIEEAPAPDLPDDVRQRLRDGAVALAREVGYVGAGTVEFLVGDDTITFLEVNARLQVEHPVTEAITGIDLVEWQLLVAQGAPLPLTQDQIELSGHAIEVRLVAEDPAAGWLPSTGRIEVFDVPDDVRCDAGVGVGSIVGTDYDSLLAKVIAHAPDRRGAARRLASALRRTVVVGPRTDLAATVAILGEPDFLDGAPTTGYLDEHPAVVDAVVPTGEDRVASLVAAVLEVESQDRAADRRWGFAPSGWRNLRVQGQRTAWIDDATGDRHDVEIVLEAHSDGTVATVRLGPPPAVTEDGSLEADDRRLLEVRRHRLDATTTLLDLDGVTSTWDVRRVGEVVVAASSSGAAGWRPLPRFVDHDTSGLGSGPVAPLPGTVVSVHVAIGDDVAEGQALVVVEAMKMEHTVRSAEAGTVTEIRHAAGDRVDAGDLLVVIQPRDEASAG